MIRKLNFIQSSLSNQTAPAGFKLVGLNDNSGQISVSNTTGRIPVVGTSSNTNITFDAERVYGTSTNPITAASLTSDLTNAQMGVVQKIYVNRATLIALPENWVKIGFGNFYANKLLLISAEWVGENRVEYIITRQYFD
jgi:hypothetical protein